ncbi:hypothetical protein GYH30_010000 [Glycine max]|uniref:UBN2 domain-containing protein n=1 Tax=Glycine max TaxID=3847 RepID=A0A0R0KFJ1_SOYBN|nr:hypothetical protein GYH30_010000 [Glycine max]
MIAFFESTHIDMWDVVEKGNHIPLDARRNETPRDRWIDEHKSKFLLNSHARNALLCTLSQEEYSNVQNFRSVKQMWDTLAIIYEGSFEVKRNKLSLLIRKYELFNMEEGEDIQNIFGRFQTILNKLRSLGRHYDNYDQIELVGILKVHGQELAQDEGTKKGKSLALMVKRPKHNSASKESLSKALAINDDSELSLITRKIRKMWKNKNSSRSKRSFHKKEKSLIICYECKKPSTSSWNKKFFKPKKKSLMSTWEDLDDSSSDEDSEEEANLCLMADVSTSKADPTLDTSSNDEDSQPDDNVNSGKELRKKNSNLWIECQHYKKMSSDLNCKLKGCEVFKELPPEIVNLYEEIENLKDKLGKFVGGHEALNKIIKVQRKPKDKSSHGFC